MANERITLTQQGYEELQREIRDLEERQRTYRSELGDFEDDGFQTDDKGAEFDIQSERDYVENRLRMLKSILAGADVSDEDPDPQRVNIGDTVTVYDLTQRQESQFTLIDGEAASFVDDGVASDSPVGAALIGRRVGDAIRVAIPDGTAIYRIERIERAST